MSARVTRREKEVLECTARRGEFTIGDPIAYTPGTGTYGYEDAPRDKGRVLGKVVGFTSKRVRVELIGYNGSKITRSVDADSLVKFGAPENIVLEPKK